LHVELYTYVSFL